MTNNINGDPRPAIEHNSFAATLIFSLAMTAVGVAAGWQIKDMYDRGDYIAIIQIAEAIETEQSRRNNGNATEVAGLRSAVATAEVAQTGAFKRGVYAGANACLEISGAPTLPIPTDAP